MRQQWSYISFTWSHQIVGLMKRTLCFLYMKQVFYNQSFSCIWHNITYRSLRKPIWMMTRPSPLLSLSMWSPKHQILLSKYSVISLEIDKVINSSVIGMQVSVSAYSKWLDINSCIVGMHICMCAYSKYCLIKWEQFKLLYRLCGRFMINKHLWMEYQCYTASNTHWRYCCLALSHRHNTQRPLNISDGITFLHFNSLVGCIMVEHLCDICIFKCIFFDENYVILNFLLNFLWNLFPRVQSTVNQHPFR